jgi:hypothetical protein
MKNIKFIFGFVCLLAIAISCTVDGIDDDTSFINSAGAPTNIEAFYNITQDNTGLVTITPNGEGAVSYEVYYGDGTTVPAIVAQGKNTSHIYKEGTYTVKIIGTSISGAKTEATQTLIVSFKAPENLKVKAEIDPANAFAINVSATADYATSFLVYFDTSNTNEVPTDLQSGKTVSFEYPSVGDYTIKVVALSGGIKTTQLVQSITISSPVALPINFEVFDASKFIGFGGASASVVNNPDTNGNTSSKVGKIIKGGPEVWAGNVIITSAPINFSTKKFITLDVWSPRPGGKLTFKLENLTDSNINIEKEVTLKGNSSWEKVTIDFSGIDVSKTYQKLVWFFDIGTVGNGSSNWTFYVDNIDLQSGDPFNDGLLTNGSFESGSDSWIVGVDNNSPVTVVTASGNTYFSTNVTTAGNPYDVNMSQKVAIIQGSTYTLTFDAWSNTNRSIISGIGLSADPWSNDTKTVNITTTRTTYTLTLAATNFGASDARVIFDLGAATGSVNIDNVSLTIN